MSLPFTYNFRNLFVRKVTTGLTVLGIGLVVAVFLCVMALSEGLSLTLGSSGSPRNLVITRQNATAELSSLIGRNQVPLLGTLPGIERDPEGRPLVSVEIVSILNIDKQDGGTSNVSMRGVDAAGMALRPAMRLVKGRLFQPGRSEVIVSKRLAGRFKNCEVGDTIKFGSARWLVVGHFDAGGTAPDSEIWSDTEGLMQTFKREYYSSVLARTTGSDGAEAFRQALAADNRLPLDVKDERAYYEAQTRTAAPLKFLAWLVGVVMAIGACFGAMNTMYAAVTARTREIATLRALGFRSGSILGAFLLESLILSLLGGIVGCALGWLAVTLATHVVGNTGTMNQTTFSEVVFAFQLTPRLYVTGMMFSVVMGFFGGLFPAFRASRVPIVLGLRQVG